MDLTPLMKPLLPLLTLFLATLATAGEPAVSAGRYHNLGLSADGAVLWWGKNEVARYRLGQNLPAVAAQRVADLPPAIAVAAGWEHSSAITRDGAVYEWGFSPYKVHQVYLLQPLLGTCVVGAILSGGHGKDPCAGAERERAARMQVNKPMRIPGLPPAVAIAASDQTTAILTREGDVHCWSLRSFPGKVEGLDHIKAIALGQFHGVALREDGVVLGWGGASGGGIAYAAENTWSMCSDPHPQAFFSGAIAIATSADSTFALRADGSIWAWGRDWRDKQDLPKEDNPTGKPDRFLARRIATLEGAVQLGGGTWPAARTAQGLLLSWYRDFMAGSKTSTAPHKLDNTMGLSSYSSVLALRRDGFVCTMGENMSGTTAPGIKKIQVLAFMPVSRADGAPLNLIDAQRAVPPGLCVEN